MAALLEHLAYLGHRAVETGLPDEPVETAWACVADPRVQEPLQAAHLSFMEPLLRVILAATLDESPAKVTLDPGSFYAEDARLLFEPIYAPRDSATTAGTVIRTLRPRYRSQRHGLRRGIAEVACRTPSLLARRDELLNALPEEHLPPVAEAFDSLERRLAEHGWPSLEAFQDVARLVDAIGATVLVGSGPLVEVSALPLVKVLRHVLREDGLCLVPDPADPDFGHCQIEDVHGQERRLSVERFGVVPQDLDSARGWHRRGVLRQSLGKRSAALAYIDALLENAPQYCPQFVADLTRVAENLEARHHELTLFPTVDDVEASLTDLDWLVIVTVIDAVYFQRDRSRWEMMLAWANDRSGFRVWPRQASVRLDEIREWSSKVDSALDWDLAYEQRPTSPMVEELAGIRISRDGCLVPSKLSCRIPFSPPEVDLLSDLQDALRGVLPPGQERLASDIGRDLADTRDNLLCTIRVVEHAPNRVALLASAVAKTVTRVTDSCGEHTGALLSGAVAAMWSEIACPTPPDACGGALRQSYERACRDAGRFAPDPLDPRASVGRELSVRLPAYDGSRGDSIEPGWYAVRLRWVGLRECLEDARGLATIAEFVSIPPPVQELAQWAQDRQLPGELRSLLGEVVRLSIHEHPGPDDQGTVQRCLDALAAVLGLPSELRAAVADTFGLGCHSDQA